MSRQIVDTFNKSQWSHTFGTTFIACTEQGAISPLKSWQTDVGCYVSAVLQYILLAAIDLGHVITANVLPIHVNNFDQNF